MASGTTVTGFGAFVPESISRVLFWSFYCVVQGFGLGLLTPSTRALQSSRLDDADQGKFWAFFGLLTGVFVPFISYFFTNVIVKPDRPDEIVQQMGLAFFIAGIGQIIISFGWVCLYLTYGRER